MTTIFRDQRVENLNTVIKKMKFGDVRVRKGKTLFQEKETKCLAMFLE